MTAVPNIKDLYKQYEKIYIQNEEKHINLQKASSKILAKLLQSGSLKDKIKSLSQIIKSNPKYCISNLNKILALLKSSNNKKDKLVIIEEIQSLFLKDLKKYFENCQKFEQIYNNKNFDNEEKYLINSLNIIVEYFNISLKELMFDNVEFFKRRGYDICLELFKGLSNNKIFIKNIIAKFDVK